MQVPGDGNDLFCAVAIGDYVSERGKDVEKQTLIKKARELARVDADEMAAKCRANVVELMSSRKKELADKIGRFVLMAMDEKKCDRKSMMIRDGMKSLFKQHKRILKEDSSEALDLYIRCLSVDKVCQFPTC